MGKIHNVVVIGASAGGFEALASLVSNLSPDFTGAVFIVIHIGSNSTGAGILNHLQKNTPLPCKLAENNEAINQGWVYIAPPDFHMMLVPGKILVHKGPMENKYRPSIDTLFRSAAVAYNSKVIGVILSGMLEDGTTGMDAIKRCGGTAIIQDPEDAPYPDMPLVAQSNVKVDFSLPVKEIGNKLNYLTEANVNAPAKIPEDLEKENEIAVRFLTGKNRAEGLGNLSAYVCPDCGGSLWQKDDGAQIHFRCHSGHTYLAESLLRQKAEGVEESLWVSLRLLEEKKNLLLLMAEKFKNEGNGSQYDYFQGRIKEAQMHIERIREFLLQ